MNRAIIGFVTLACSVAAIPSAQAASKTELIIDGQTTIVLSVGWGTVSTADPSVDRRLGTATPRPTTPVPAGRGGRRQYEPLMVRADPATPAFDDLAKASDVSSFTLTLDPASPLLATLCTKGARIAQATLRTEQGEFAMKDVTVTGCSRQTQGSTFGEKVGSGLQSGAGALAQGASLTLTGELRNAKTGHVTLMK